MNRICSHTSRGPNAQNILVSTDNSEKNSAIFFSYQMSENVTFVTKKRRTITYEIEMVVKKLEDTAIMETAHQVDADSLVESPKNIVHCWYNESDKPLKFLVIKAPKPDKPTTFLGS